jgi:hypothetical protein
MASATNLLSPATIKELDELLLKTESNSKDLIHSALIALSSSSLDSYYGNLQQQQQHILLNSINQLQPLLKLDHEHSQKLLHNTLQDLSRSINTLANIVLPAAYLTQPTLQERKLIDHVNSILNHGILSPLRRQELDLTSSTLALSADQVSTGAQLADKVHINVIPYSAFSSKETLEKAVASSLYADFRGGLSVALERPNEKKLPRKLIELDDAQLQMCQLISQMTNTSLEDVKKKKLIEYRLIAPFTHEVLLRFEERIKNTALIFSDYQTLRDHLVTAKGERKTLDDVRTLETLDSYEDDLPGSITPEGIQIIILPNHLKNFWMNLLKKIS